MMLVAILASSMIVSHWLDFAVTSDGYGMYRPNLYRPCMTIGRWSYHPVESMGRVISNRLARGKFGSPLWKRLQNCLWGRQQRDVVHQLLRSETSQLVKLEFKQIRRSLVLDLDRTTVGNRFLKPECERLLTSIIVSSSSIISSPNDNKRYLFWWVHAIACLSAASRLEHPSSLALGQFALGLISFESRRGRESGQSREVEASSWGRRRPVFVSITRFYE